LAIDDGSPQVKGQEQMSQQPQQIMQSEKSMQNKLVAQQRAALYMQAKQAPDFQESGGMARSAAGGFPKMKDKAQMANTFEGGNKKMFQPGNTNSMKPPQMIQ
jgi:hypothetical protein